MIAWFTNKEADEIGNGYIKQFYDKCPSNSLCVDIEGFAKLLGLDIVYETINERDANKIGFLSDGKTALHVIRNNKTIKVIFPIKTIVIEKYLLKANESGRKRFTIAHEIAHYLIRNMYPEVASARYYNSFADTKTYSLDEIKSIFTIEENRADTLAAALLMPTFNVEKAMKKYANEKPFAIYGETTMNSEDKKLLSTMANGIGVSVAALRIRLKNLGLLEMKPIEDFINQDFHEGDFNDSDIIYNRNKGSLSKEQIYLIHRSERENEESKKLSCPACGYKLSSVSSDAVGIVNFKCGKCGFERPLNLAYFRTTKSKQKYSCKTIATKRKQER